MLLLVNKPLNFMGILTIGEVVTELGETVEPAETPMMLLSDCSSYSLVWYKCINIYIYIESLYTHMIYIQYIYIYILHIWYIYIP